MIKYTILLLLPFLLFSQEIAPETKILLKSPSSDHSYSYFRSCGYGLYKEEEFLYGTSMGLGSRHRNKNFGGGFSINLTYLGFCPYFSFKGEILHYMQETPDSYFVGFAIDAGPHYDYLSEWIFLAKGELLFGKEFQTKAGKKSFAYLGIDPFFKLIEENITPLISINYGWGF